MSSGKKEEEKQPIIKTDAELMTCFPEAETKDLPVMLSLQKGEELQGNDEQADPVLQSSLSSY